MRQAVALLVCAYHTPVGRQVGSRFVIDLSLKEVGSSFVIFVLQYFALHFSQGTYVTKGTNFVPLTRTLFAAPWDLHVFRVRR